MTEAQAAATLHAQGASYKAFKNGVQWFKARDGSWIAKTVAKNGDVTLQRLPAGSCGC